MSEPGPADAAEPPPSSVESGPADAAEPPPSNAEPGPADAAQPPPNGIEQAGLPERGVLTIGEGAVAVDTPDKPWTKGVPEADRRAARELFLEGNRLFRIPLFAKAAEQYVAALRKWKHPAIYLNLAIAQLNAGQEVEARDTLEHALEHGEEPLGTDNFRGARLQLEQVTGQLGRIRVTCQTPGAQVTLDGIPLFTGPGSYEGWVKAKDHEVTAKKPEYLSEARRVTVTSRQPKNIVLKLITLSEAADASRRWAVWKPWVALAAGAAIVGAGGISHALAFQKYKSFDREFSSLTCAREAPHACPEQDPDLPKLAKLQNDLKLATQERSIAIGAYVVGGSLAVASIVLLYLNRTRIAEQRLGVIGNSDVTITPMMSNNISGVLVRVAH